LKVICKSYGRPFSNKNKEKLVETVLEGPMIGQSITQVERILKYSFLQSLTQEDHSAHKLGSLNKDIVCSVSNSNVSKFGWELLDAFECGLLHNKMIEYLATSLDGWIVMKYHEQSGEWSVHSDSDDSVVSIDPLKYNCGKLCIPQFREDGISSKTYPISRDSIVFT
jgi:hypothetical protein